MNNQLSLKKFVLPEGFIKKIDVSVHRPNSTLSEIHELCEIGLKEGFNVITNSNFTKFARQFIGPNASIQLGATVGFPFGTASTPAKAFEAQRAIEDGANEVDMVMAIGLLREGPQYYSLVEEDIRAVVDSVHKSGGAVTKVIIETCYLSKEEKIAACKLVTNAGAEFIKTSTGYGPAGATIGDVVLMRKESGTNIKVKAAGGIRTLDQCIEYFQAGADRLGIGLSSTLGILKEVRKIQS